MFWMAVIGTFILGVMVFSANFMIRKSVDSGQMNYASMNKMYDEFDQEVFKQEEVALDKDEHLHLDIADETLT